MAKTALTQLQDQLEAIRREAYDAGYAAAMQAIRDFVARPSATPAPAPRARAGRVTAVKATAATAKAVKATAGRQRRAPAKAAAASRRPQRGTNAKLIAEVLQAMPAGTARPAEIRSALQRDKGVEMAFTSIRHALGQLATRREVVASDDGKSWRYLGIAS